MIHIFFPLWLELEGFGMVLLITSASSCLKKKKKTSVEF